MLNGFPKRAVIAAIAHAAVWLCVSVTVPAHADTLPDAEPGGVYIETSQASRDDLEALFAGLQDAIAGELIEQDPIVVVLHGADASAFVRQNYASNKMLVDQAALLDSYGLIDVRMCATWLASNGFDSSDLPPYIDTVRYGFDEVERLVADGYTPYGSVDL